MVAERLYHYAESNKIFSPHQAGFRKDRGCEDQITRVIQQIQDGFHSKPMKRSVLVLLDFSKAYDMVWREKLLLSMLKQGIPPGLVKWIRHFLVNRQARVKFNSTESKCRIMRQGLPQGSVLSPILFLLYINHLANLLPQNNVNAMFANDVSILATESTKEEAQIKAHEAVDIVVEWARNWKLRLNATKSEVSHFTTNSMEARWEPKIEVDGTIIRREPNPRLLGVILDRNLRFGPHADHVASRIETKKKIIGAVANTEWG